MNEEEICPLPKMTEVDRYNYYITGDYQIHVRTDASGNNVSREVISTQQYEDYNDNYTDYYCTEFGYHSGVEPYEILGVYDAHFLNMNNSAGGYYARIPENIRIKFDKPDTEGVIAD